MATTAQIQSFIQTLGRLAVAECNNRIASGKGFVLPSVCIAQSAIETGWGTAGIMVKANAYFGIKAGGSWTGAVYRADTWEVANGEAYNTSANFRAYGSLAESVTDYYNLIGNASRYSKALSKGSDRSKWLTPKACITAIWAGGYATDTLYVEKIMNTITARNLTEYDALITGEGSLPIPDVYKTVSKADLTAGSLAIIDSGRAVENKRDDNTAVALEWERAIEVTADDKIKVVIVIPTHLELTTHFIKLSGDTVTQIDAKGDATITVTKGDKIGFYISSDNGAPLPLSDIPEAFRMTFETSFPSAIEITPSAFAFFVKIE